MGAISSGKPRPHDPYGLTQPDGWPEADEIVLREWALSFRQVSTAVQRKIDATEGERAQLFAGAGPWSGLAAKTAEPALCRTIADLHVLQKNLGAVATFYADCAALTAAAKDDITTLVIAANKLLDWIRDHDGIPLESKILAINEGISAIRETNAKTVLSASLQISAKQAPPVDAYDDRAEQASETDSASTEPGIVLASNVEEVVGAPRNFEHPPWGTTGSAPDSDTTTGSHFLPESSRLPDPTEDTSTPQPELFDDDRFKPEAQQDVAAAPHQSAPPPMPGGLSLGTGPNFLNPGAPPHPTTPYPFSTAPGLSSAMATPAASVPTAATPNTAPTTPTTPTGPTTPLTQTQEFQKSFLESAAKSTAQQPLTPPLPPTSPAGVPLSAQPPASPPTAPNIAPVNPMQTATGPSTTAGPAPVVPPSTPGPAPSTPMPLGPAPTPPPAAPVAPTAAAPPLATVAGAASSGSVVGAPAPTPVPVSAARAHREAVAASLRRPGNDMTQIAQRLAAALNVGITDIGFYWLTGLTKDNTIVVANNYALGYIPENVHLPEQVKFATADESIPAGVRATWVTYPILALHGWCQHHGTELRAVIATEDQFKGFDPGAPKIILRPDDIPDNGNMEGRHRLQVIAPAAAAQLAAVPPAGLTELLPTRPADDTPPNDNRADLWFEVFRPLLSSDPGRAKAQLEAFATYAEHAQEIALHRAHTATEAADQRAAIADWIYWQHLAVLVSDATAANTAV